MATTGVINGDILTLLTSTDGTTYTEVTLLTGNSLSVSHSPRSTTSKDDNGWESSLEGMRSWSISCNGYYANDAANGGDALVAAARLRTLMYLKFTTGVTGDKVYSGTAYVESAEVDGAGPGESATFSAEFKGTGSLASGTVS